MTTVKTMLAHQIIDKICYGDVVIPPYDSARMLDLVRHLEHADNIMQLIRVFIAAKPITQQRVMIYNILGEKCISYSMPAYSVNFHDSPNYGVLDELEMYYMDMLNIHVPGRSYVATVTPPMIHSV